MMSEMKKQKNLILERNWDVLLILDACRYDYFEKLHGKYFKGNLEKVKSKCLSDSFWKKSGGRTVIWLKNTFTKRMKNIVYVSGNPHVNSMGIDKSGEGFNPPKIFPVIMDVWDWGWNSKLGTTPPAKMVEGTKKAKRKYPEKDLIIHFVQPHCPYLALSKGKEEVNISSSSKSFLDKGREIGARVLRSIFSEKRVFDFKKILGGPEYQNQGERVAKKYGKEKLEILYEDNLSSALEGAREIASLFSDSSIVVSADHGEFLGEDGLYGHSWNKEFLTRVPWFEVESVPNID